MSEKVRVASHVHQLGGEFRLPIGSPFSHGTTPATKHRETQKCCLSEVAQVCETGELFRRCTRPNAATKQAVGMKMTLATGVVVCVFLSLISRLALQKAYLTERTYPLPSAHQDC